MIANATLSAVRAIQRDPLHAAVNVTGLAVALAASLLIALFVKHELGYESHFAAPERVFRVEAEFRSPEVAPRLSESSPFALTGLLESDFEGRLVATRLIRGQPTTVVAGDARLREVVAVGDERLLDVLDFRALEGDLAAALREPGAVAVTWRMATRLFGDAEALGEVIRVGDQLDLRVAAVLEDPPKSSRFQFDILGSLATPGLAPAPDMATNWSNWGQETYVRLLGEMSADALEAQLPGLVERHRPESDDGSEIALSLRPLRAIHLAELPDGSIGDRNAVAALALAATGAFLVFIACFSYVNLATARALLRTKEIGLRKILGGRTSLLAAQFFGESLAITLMAFALAAALAAASLPAFANLTDRPIALADALTPGFAAVAAALLILTSLVAGGYPALVLASRKPAELFQKRPGAADATGLLRTGIVSLQFALTTALMIVAVVAYAQIRHLRTLDLGFDPAGVLTIAVFPEHMQSGADLTFRDRLAASPFIEAATARSLSPRSDYGLFTEMMEADGRPPVEPVLGGFAGDPLFFEVYGVTPLAGRTFDDARGTDYFRLPSQQEPVAQSAIVLSESAVSAYRFASPEDAVGKTLTWPLFGGRTEFTVIGVVPDIHVRLGRQEMLPTAYAMNDPASQLQFFAFPEVAARVRPGAAAAALEDAQSIWSEQFPDAPMRYEFIEDRLAAANADDDRLSKLLAFFASLSVLVACLGLFALASFVAAQRTHEVAVRKVLGASAARVARLLMWDFAKPVLLANAVAWPLAYLALRPWLDRFAYRIELSPTFFLGASALALAVAMATILVRMQRAARVHPALVLREE